MSKVIEVKYSALQNADEIYIGTSIPKKLYIRQAGQNKEHAIWSLATKTADGYEAGTPIKAGVTIQVVMGNKKEKLTLFEETVQEDVNGVLYAEKAEHFVSDQLKNAMKELNKKLSLHNYDSWAKWLLKDCSKYNYTGYQDNWLHFGTVLDDEANVETITIVGVPYTVIMASWRHMVTDKTWKVVEIRDAKSSVMELCGYSYDV